MPSVLPFGSWKVTPSTALISLPSTKKEVLRSFISSIFSDRYVTPNLVYIYTLVEEPEGNVHNQVHYNETDRDYEYGTLHDREVPLQYGIDDQTAKTVDCEYTFGQYGTAEEVAELKTDYCYNRDQGIL